MGLPSRPAVPSLGFPGHGYPSASAGPSPWSNSCSQAVEVDGSRGAAAGQQGDALLPESLGLSSFGVQPCGVTTPWVFEGWTALLPSPLDATILTKLAAGAPAGGVPGTPTHESLQIPTVTLGNGSWAGGGRCRGHLHFQGWVPPRQPPSSLPRAWFLPPTPKS